MNDTTPSPGNEDEHYYGDVQPIDLIESAHLDWHQGSAIQYIARCKRKGGTVDIEKAIWVLRRYLNILSGGDE